MFIVQRTDGDETWVSLMTTNQLIDYINFDDCHNESYVIWNANEFGVMKPLRYKGWQPNCLIELVDEKGNVVVSGYGEDH